MNSEETVLITNPCDAQRCAVQVRDTARNGRHGMRQCSSRHATRRGRRPCDRARRATPHDGADVPATGRDAPRHAAGLRRTADAPRDGADVPVTGPRHAKRRGSGGPRRATPRGAGQTSPRTATRHATRAGQTSPRTATRHAGGADIPADRDAPRRAAGIRRTATCPRYLALGRPRDSAPGSDFIPLRAPGRETAGSALREGA
jgi:hypothetical protein